MKRIAVVTDSNSSITPREAKELGVYDIVKRDGGWGNVSAKKCGSMVAKAIEIANSDLEKNIEKMR